MKKILVILLIVCAIVWGVGNKQKVSQYAEQAKSWFDKTVLKKDVDQDAEEGVLSDADDSTVPEDNREEEMDVKDAPPSSSRPTTSTPEVVETLPEGFYYTKERITMVTDTGVAAIAKAVRVQKIGEQEGDYLISDGVNQLPAAPHLLTRDEAEINGLTAALAAAAPATTKKPDSKPAPASSTSIKKTPNPEVVNLKAKLKNLDNRIYQLQTEIRKLEAEQAYAKMRGRVSSVHVQIGRVQSQLNHVQVERNRTAAQLSEIQ